MRDVLLRGHGPAEFSPYDAEPATGTCTAGLREDRAEMFPRAWRVALGCAAEPMIHPNFREILSIAGRYGVPDLWFPTNLLALTPRTPRRSWTPASARSRPRSTGRRKRLRENPRAGKWERLLSRLELLRTSGALPAGNAAAADHLHLDEIQPPGARGPAGFCRGVGRDELDVRYVSPTVGVDVGPELLTERTPGLERRARRAAKDAVRRGLKLASYPSSRPAPSDRALCLRARGGASGSSAPASTAGSTAATPSPSASTAALTRTPLRYSAQRRGRSLYLLGGRSDRFLSGGRALANLSRRSPRPHPRRVAQRRAGRDVCRLWRTPNSSLTV